MASDAAGGGVLFLACGGTGGSLCGAGVALGAATAYGASSALNVGLDVATDNMPAVRWLLGDWYD